jgi:photosystem II stability/assembly factor-like uncharacterized protein
MKKLLFGLCIFAAALSVPAASYSQHTWQRLGGPWGGRVQAIIAAPNGDFYAYAALNEPQDTNTKLVCVISRSTDKGETWNQLPSQPPDLRGWNHVLYDFTFTANGTIVAGFWLTDSSSYRERLYTSTDFGESWSLLSPAGGGFIGSGKPGEYYVVYDYDFRSVQDSILRTTDNGVTWQNITSKVGSNISAIVWNGGNSYTAVGNPSVTTEDGWQTTSSSGGISGSQITRLGNGKLFILNNGIATITDFVNSTSYSVELPDQVGGIQPVAVFGDGRIAALTNINVAYDSSDLANDDFYGGAYYPLLYLYNSDSGAMVPVPTMPTPEYNYPVGQPFVNGLLPTVAGDSTGTILYSTGDGIYKTTDDGASWREVSIAYDNPTQLQIDRQGRIFTKRTEYYQDPSWIQMSENGGQTWTRIGPLTHAFWGILGEGYQGGITTIAGTSHGLNCGDYELFYYGGVEVPTWTMIGQVVYPPGTEIVTDSADNLLFNDGYFLVSDDEGISWNSLPTTPTTPLSFAFSPSWVMYIADSTSLYRSSDYGTTWTEMEPKIRYLDITSILAQSDSNLYVTTQQKGIYHSTNDGATWSPLVGPWGDTVNCLAATPDGTLYEGTQSLGLFSSKLDGSSPVQEPLTLITNQINTIYVDKQNDVYVAAMGSPLWKMQGAASSGVASTSVTGPPYNAQIVTGGTSSSLRIVCNADVELQIELYNTLGERIRDFGSQLYTPGLFNIPLNLNDLPSGAYFVRVASGGNPKVLGVVH